jgi:hypothetical protein
MTSRWFAVQFALLACLAGMARSEVAASGQVRNATNQAANTFSGNALTRLEALKAIARANGLVPVIVRLSVNFQIERALAVPP